MKILIYILIALQAIGLVGSLYTIGKPREPLTPGIWLASAAITLFNMYLLLLLVLRP